MYLYNSVSKIELKAYYAIWISAVLYSIYSFSKSSTTYFQYYKDEFNDFDQGWPSLSTRKDSADYEWETAKYLIKGLYKWIFLHVFISEILRQLELDRVLKKFQIAATAAIIFLEMGVFSLVVVALQPLIFMIIIGWWPNKYLVWFCNALALYFLSQYKDWASTKQYTQFFELWGHEPHVLILTVFWMNLKCVSYCLDCINDGVKLKSLDLFSYCFYLPTVFCGPFISYKNYEPRFRLNWGDGYSFFVRIGIFIRDLARFTFWYYFAEFWLHFIYVNATTFHPEWVETLSPWSLYGYGYTMGQFFHIKYVVLYGFSTSVAKFENIEVPTLPICIGRVHLYSDMWKYFDAGLYNFLISYIYIPSIKVIGSRLFSSFICFLFVFIWHGTETYILIWTGFNYVAVMLEVFVKKTYDDHLRSLTIVERMGPKWRRRLGCVVASPLLAFSAISNFYFFARTDVGNVFLFRFLTDHWSTTLGLLVLLYACGQVSTDLRLRRSNSEEKCNKV